MIMIPGCRTFDSSALLPSKEKESVGFSSFDEAHHAYESILVGETNEKDLSAIGFDSVTASNMKVLTYTDIMAMFMSNPNISKNDVPPGVLKCLQAKAGCRAYQFASERIDDRRYGNFFVDLLNFRKRSHKTGWRFEVLVVIVDGTVEYAMYSGERNINIKEIRRNPLGPLQDLDAGDLQEAAGY
jgi:hypothetical protein